MKGKTGYPDLGFPVFDPLKIEKMNIEQAGDGPVTLKINLRNIEMNGMSQMKFYKMDGFRKEIDKAKIEMRFKCPALNIQGPYKLDGRVLVLPVQGDGIINLTLGKISRSSIKHSTVLNVVYSFRLADVDVTMKLLGKKSIKQGKEHFEIDKSKLSFETKNVHVHFGNLFNGNKELGESTNAFFNENWQIILKEIKPAISESIASVFESLIDNVFANVPYSEMFL